MFIQPKYIKYSKIIDDDVLIVCMTSSNHQSDPTALIYQKTEVLLIKNGANVKGSEDDHLSPGYRVFYPGDQLV